MSRFSCLAAWLGLTLGALPAYAATATSDLVYFGSHGTQTQGAPPPGGGNRPVAAGPPAGGQRPPQKPVDIYAARFDEATGQLTLLGPMAQLARPTWMTANPEKPIIYSDNEIGSGPADPGQVVAFKIDPASGGLSEINRVGAVGGGTTYVSFDPVTQTVFASNFNTGHVVAIPVKPDGSLGEASSSQLDYGKGPNRRQPGPHAHSVIIDPSHHFVLVPDMGADRVFVYKFDDATRTLSPAATPFAQFPPGTGPRHAVFSPNGRYLYVMTELTAEIHSFAWDAATGSLTPIQTFKTINKPPAGALTMDGAEVAISANGKFLYSSTRLDNSISVYAIDARNGHFAQIQHISSQGENPWSFTIDPSGHWMLVTDERSSLVAVLKIDPTSGKLTATGESIKVPHPVSATFISG